MSLLITHEKNKLIIQLNQLAKRLLNWQPKMNLKDMCKDGLRWKQFNRKQCRFI